MKLGILQFKPELGRVGDNLQTIRKFLIRRKFDLAVLPELATCGYNFLTRKELAESAEGRNGRSFGFFEELAVKTGGAIVWGTAEKSRNKIYNSAVLTTPEGDHHIYRKTHLFCREKNIFDPGNTGFKVFTWRKIRIGVMICFDWIFPESARTLALAGSQIICHPSNLVMSYCQDSMITRSLENGLYTATANRVGTEKNGSVSYKFTGMSQVTDMLGNRLLRFSRSEQGFQMVKINPKSSDTKKVNRMNNLFADRRPEYYKIKSGRDK